MDLCKLFEELLTAILLLDSLPEPQLQQRDLNMKFSTSSSTSSFPAPHISWALLSNIATIFMGLAIVRSLCRAALCALVGGNSANYLRFIAALHTCKAELLKLKSFPNSFSIKVSQDSSFFSQNSACTPLPLSSCPADFRINFAPSLKR